MKNALKKTDKKAEDHGADTLLLEIQEEIKRDEMIKLLRRHGNTVITLLVLLVVSVAGYQIFQHYDRQANQKSAALVLGTLQNPTPDLKALDTAAKNRKYADLANLSKANLLVKNGELDKALAEYQKVSANGHNQIFRDLATLNAANLELNKNPADDKIEKQLKQLIDGKSYFSYTAKDLLAVYYVQNNKNTEAKAILQDLSSDANAPVTISHRAKQLLSAI
jgi:hypothetical protein